MKNSNQVTCTLIFKNKWKQQNTFSSAQISPINPCYGLPQEQINLWHFLCQKENLEGSGGPSISDNHQQMGFGWLWSLQDHTLDIFLILIWPLTSQMHRPMIQFCFAIYQYTHIHALFRQAQRQRHYICVNKGQCSIGPCVQMLLWYMLWTVNFKLLEDDAKMKVM